MVEVPAIFAGSYLILGFLMTAAGIAIIYIGYRTRPKGITATMKEQKLGSVFCRYCGKNTVSGEFCSACGKSSQSKSVNMKICRNIFHFWRSKCYTWSHGNHLVSRFSKLDAFQR